MLTRYKTIAQRELAVRRLQRLARWLDYAFLLPILKKRIGWDGIIGLIPLLGDVVMAGLGLFIILEGFRLGASWNTIGQMVLNLAADTLIGEIPLLGDAFDFLFQANRRNLILLGIDVRTTDDLTIPLPRPPRA
jgi:hypothetical protein